MSSSDNNADLFFAAPRYPDRAAGRPRRPKRRKSAHTPSSSDDEDNDGHAFGRAGASSDLEVVGTSSCARSEARTRDHGRATPIASTSTLGLAAAAAASASGLSLTLSSSGSSSESDSDVGPSGSPRRRGRHRRAHSRNVLPTATQVDKDGDKLLELARQNGWRGNTPPRRTRKPEEPRTAQRVDPPQEEEEDRLPTPSDASSGVHTGRRRQSVSTEQTTVSDHSSSAPKSKRATVSASSKTNTAPIDARPASRDAAPAAPRRRRRPPSPVGDRSPSPQLLGALAQPDPPESFWGVEAQPARRKGAPATRLAAGAASKALRALSEQRAMLVLGDEDEEDDIARASSSSSSSYGGGGREAGSSRYEPVADRAKRKKEEALAKLKASRTGKSGPQAKLPLQPAPNGSISRTARGGLPVESGQTTGCCPICREEVALSELDPHTNACLDAVNALDSSDTTLLNGQPEEVPPPPLASKSAGPTPRQLDKSAFRPAGGSTPAVARAIGPVGSRLVAATRPEAVPSPTSALEHEKDLAAQLFPSSSPRESHPGPSRPPHTKGKGKTTLVPDCDDPDHDDDGFIDEDETDSLVAAWMEADDAALYKTVTEVVDLLDDEEDEAGDDDGDIVVAGPSQHRSAAARTATVVGGEGAVNTSRRPGPPENGSSPPRGSIYLSTLRRAYREGYESMYARAPTKRVRGNDAGTAVDLRNGGEDYGANDDENDEARALDAMAPPVKARLKARSTSGGWGKGRRGSWGRRGARAGAGARGRGRGRKSG